MYLPMADEEITLDFNFINKFNKAFDVAKATGKLVTESNQDLLDLLVAVL